MFFLFSEFFLSVPEFHKVKFRIALNPFPDTFPWRVRWKLQVYVKLQIYWYEVRELYLEFNIDAVALNICGA